MDIINVVKLLLYSAAGLERHVICTNLTVKLYKAIMLGLLLYFT